LTLAQILKQSPEKRESISRNLIEMVRNCVKKDIINLDFVHTLLLQSLEIGAKKDIEVGALLSNSYSQELVSLFKEQIHQLVHTPDGAHAACLLISYGTAKDRKAMIKSIREMVGQIAVDSHAHMVLVVICAVVDDTKLVSKAVLGELQESWRELIRDKSGRKLALFLCREDNDPFMKECREKSVSTRYRPRYC